MVRANNANNNGRGTDANDTPNVKLSRKAKKVEREFTYSLEDITQSQMDILREALKAQLDLFKFTDVSDAGMQLKINDLTVLLSSTEPVEAPLELQLSDVEVTALDTLLSYVASGANGSHDIPSSRIKDLKNKLKGL